VLTGLAAQIMAFCAPRAGRAQRSLVCLLAVCQILQAAGAGRTCLLSERSPDAG